MPYGDNGGWPAIHLHMMLNGPAIPVHVDAPSIYHPLHADDILAMVPRLLEAASVPAVTVNWGGSEPVSIEEWCTYLAGLAGTEARFEPTTQTIDSVAIDTTRMHELAGQTSVPWREGMRAHGQGAASRPGAVSAGPGGATGELRFVLCDPEELPASELLAAMRAELIGAYDNASRLDNPPLLPGGAACARRRLLRRVRGPRGRGGWGAAATRRRRGGNQADVRAARGAVARRGGRTAAQRSRRRPGRWATRAPRLDTGPKQVTAQRLYRGAGYAEIAPYNDNPFACFWGEKRLV